MSILLRGVLIFGLLVVVVSVLIVIVFTVAMIRYEDPRDALETFIPYLEIESVVQDASGEAVILCGPWGWVSTSDAVSHLRNSQVAYGVKVPNQGTYVPVDVEEQPAPNMPVGLSASADDTDLLDALPPCNVADYHQYVPQELR